MTGGVVYWVRLGKQRELKAGEGGKSSWEQQAWQLWGRYWHVCFVQHQHFAFCHQLECYRKKGDFTLRESGVVYGPVQRLPTAVLSGWGKALTSKSIRHVFPLGGGPFLDLCQFLWDIPQQRSRLTRFMVYSGHHGLFLEEGVARPPPPPGGGTGGCCCSSLQVFPSGKHACYQMCIGFAERVIWITLKLCPCTASSELWLLISQVTR